MRKKLVYINLMLFIIMVLLPSGCNNNRNGQDAITPKEVERQYKRIAVEWPEEFGLREGTQIVERYVNLEFFNNNLYLYTEDCTNELGNINTYELSKDTLKWVKTKNSWPEIDECRKRPDLFEKDVETGEGSRIFTQKIYHGSDNEVYFDVTKTIIMGPETTKIFRLKDGETSEIFMEQTSGEEPTMAISFLYDNKHLLLSYLDGSIKVFDTEEEKIKTQWGMEDYITGLRILSNGLYKLENGNISILDTLSWDENSTLNCEGMDINEDSDYLIINKWEFYEGEDRSYCIIDDGIYAWNTSTNEDREKLIEKDVLGSGIYNITSFFVDEDENIFLKYKSKPASQNNLMESFDKLVVYMKE